jgi:hypothetical protein
MANDDGVWVFDRSAQQGETLMRQIIFLVIVVATVANRSLIMRLPRSALRTAALRITHKNVKLHSFRYLQLRTHRQFSHSLPLLTVL